MNVFAAHLDDYESNFVWHWFHKYLMVDSFSKKEMLEFLDSFDTQQFQKIQDFFETMPKLSHTVDVTNPNTGVKSQVVIEGLASFFD